MGKWIHRIVESDPDSRTGVCANCGPVQLTQASNRLMCTNAKKQYRGTRRPEHGRRPPHRRIGRHGLNQLLARALRHLIGACEICGSTDGLAVDHCHETRTVRGVLCRACNTSLGFMKDDPSRLRAAALYLEERAA